MNAPSISVSITVYNLEKYVEKCILSIINQTFTDFEFIIVDDGSTDTSGDICRFYEQKDKRITYIYQSNQGVSSARNKALEASRGKYVYMADGDDMLKPNMLENLHLLCEKNKADISTCRIQCIDEYGQLIGTPKEKDKIYIMTNEEALFKTYTGELTGYGVCNKLFNRRLFQNVTFPLGRKFEDAAVLYRLIQQANKVIYTEEAMYYYVIHAESMTRKNLTKYSSKRLDIIKNFEECIEFLKQQNTSKYVIDIIAADYYKSLRGLTIDIMKEDKNIQKNSLQTVNQQINKWKHLFLSNFYVSRKQEYLIFFWSRLPGLTLMLYRIRNQLVLKLTH
ncbi:glycosyltransferase [Salipaludibacillus sp. CUR1]|uniref:glycosyltransferase family 2 protein n=1 Tax=Salipaludibacillus sp. CUR1 TaxID=2820003 RepID=UPI001E5899F1|nr:glycosyltransferase [Salipaludibacillus sp. CUR1]MCE7792676.1 glycosyltransferase [Salipaludibacillus sp. CUR1]